MMFKRFLSNFQRVMQGRYGYDELSRFLIIFSLVLMILSMIKILWFLNIFALICLMWATFRCYSKNIQKRLYEQEQFLKITQKPRKFFSVQKMKWQDRKIYRYFKCKNCKATLRVPKGKGKIEITCPKCKTKEIKHT